MLRLSIENESGRVLAAAASAEGCSLVYDGAYRQGDRIRVQAGPGLALLWLDDAMPPAPVDLPEGEAVYPIPWGEARGAYSPRAFAGTRHCLQLRALRPGEREARRNLALNPYAQPLPNGIYPYASANVETRGEAVFAARNAIDGLTANHGHGAWPYTSWGINQDPAAALRVDFGRPVLADEAVLYLRADFPHDAWWREASLHFSDGSTETFPLRKTDEGQRFPFAARETAWVLLDRLVRAEDDPSPFPALTQLEIWGTESNAAR